MSSEQSDKEPTQSEPSLAPLSAKETLSILFAGHIGVRKAEQRVEDFRRASGPKIFIAAMLYFSLIVVGLIILVRIISS